ncbi:MAG: hypothetical protein NBV61_04295 [Algoriphagus sp.]|nr:hypothetical protein [Algoriphagus sp.]
MKLFLFYFYLIFLFSSLKEDVNLYFEPNNKQNCSLNQTQIGRFHSEKGIRLYEKILQVNGDIDFYVCKEKFRYEVSKHGEKKVIPSELIKNVKFSKIDDLLELVQEKNPFYPSSMFDEIFIYEKQYDGSFLKYKVSWEYYIE